MCQLKEREKANMDSTAPALETHLMFHVGQRIRSVDGETYQDDMRLGIGQGPETLVVFLAGRIPQRQLHWSAIDAAIGHVILKDGRLLEGVAGESVSRIRARLQVDGRVVILTYSCD